MNWPGDVEGETQVIAPASPAAIVRDFIAELVAEHPGPQLTVPLADDTLYVGGKRLCLVDTADKRVFIVTVHEAKLVPGP